ncbi:Uncharacterised protein [Mycobacteroides abscessus subsp. massiliense]|uniref:helix-turn-helix domain-containing protein n=1 Tax=Mycobacteroides abscessus TaxID=36809 RepID=UPI0009A81F9E|nr:helix-turn-helix transcriptional regulator [Mycobacteroides abscessus]SKM82698.1 Uncharacterised protein [Mycobacteroides abscessus subsp. massiliense]SKM99409.1 Uncharacterised protein [Mycobacteroides abscessus subsp. massiliense]SKN77971.1 Uncharacterised protein [Mycobacteroides abscessus subsp. massiliense]SKN95172.1 Uncharacterised protein [Mycobacteroides abscessus subsp. massiliense]SKO23186.1 Uncharacterised protein [Mycobacteroides abscessus subsp. massiliense]
MGRQRVNIAELARRTQIARSTLSAQINSENITVKTLLRAAAALKVRPVDLLPALNDLAA